MIAELSHALRRGLGRFRAEFATTRTLNARSRIRKIQDVDTRLDGTYYFTSEKGVFRLDQSGVFSVLDVPTYGIAIGHDRVFLAVQSHDYALVLRGDRRALSDDGCSFGFEEIYRLRTLSTNERIHGIFLGDEALWVANTGRNTLLRIDPDAARVEAEIPLFLDRFGQPVLYNNNHINSVSEYAGVVLFAAYRAGRQSMIGIYDGVGVTGYGYHRPGIHDIYLRDGGFVFCDTFGANREDAGGAPVTEAGVLDADYFAAPPGCVVRGLAGTPGELLIGHSHKGARARRFAGHGAILIARDGRVADRIPVGPAQVYQIITEDGGFLSPPPNRVDAAAVKGMLRAALGEPIYEAEVAPL